MAEFASLSSLSALKRKVAATVKKYDGNAVSVVISSSERYDNKTPVGDVAKFVEYGTAKMPPRPFARVARIANTRKWYAQLAQELASGGSVQKALRTVGETMRADVQKEISAMGMSKTGKLFNSLTVKVT